MKPRHLIHSFIFAVISINNLMALHSEESILSILLTTGFMIGCAAASAYNLHLYLTQPKDKR